MTYNQYVNPIAIAAIQWKYYFLFLGLQVFFFIYAYFFFLETKAYTMEEVARVFDGKQAVEEVQTGAHLSDGKAMRMGLGEKEVQHREKT